MPILWSDGDMSMKKRSVYIYYLIPILVHLIFLPLLFFERSGRISFIEIFVGTIAVPIYLVGISYKLLDNFGICKFFSALLATLSVTLFGIVIGYFNWGITTGNLLNPDGETIHIFNLEMVISTIIVFVGWIILSCAKRK